ncbi:MAG: hypothetical protein WC656_11030 [Sulfurimonas sp.]
MSKVLLSSLLIGFVITIFSGCCSRGCDTFDRRNSSCGHYAPPTWHGGYGSNYCDSCDKY